MPDTARARLAEASPQTGPALPTLQGAFSALTLLARRAPRSAGSIAAYPLPTEIRTAWLVGVRGGLNESPVASIAVTSNILNVGGTPLDIGSESPIPSRLSEVGVSALTLWRGAADPELVALAALLCTAWRPGDAGSLHAEIWAANFEHVWFDCTLPQRPDFPIAPRAFGAIPAGVISESAGRHLRELRETAAPVPGAFIEVHATTRALPAELAAEVAALLDGADISAAALGLAVAHTGGAVQRLVEPALDLIRAGREGGRLFHPFIERVRDPDVEHELRAWAETTLPTVLQAGLSAEDSTEGRSTLFSMMHLLPQPCDFAPLAERLPRWGMQVLADVLLAREIEAGQERSAISRLRLATRGEFLLGLAMASRLDDVRLTDLVLSLVDHATPEIREAAILALRAQNTPRIQQRVARALDDSTPAVRIEALRYAVAHRVPTVISWLERAITDSLSGREDLEARAICVAYGKLARDRAESGLLGLGRRQAPTARFALHGLRAVGGPRARTAIEQLRGEFPTLREEADLILRDLS